MTEQISQNLGHKLTSISSEKTINKFMPKFTAMTATS